MGLDDLNSNKALTRSAVRSTFFSQMSPLVCLHCTQPALILWATSVSIASLLWNTDPQIFLNLVEWIPACPPVPHWKFIYSVFSLLILSLLPSKAWWRDPYLSDVIGEQHALTSCRCTVRRSSINILKRNGLRAEPWFTPTLTLKLFVILQAVLTLVICAWYVSCTILMKPGLTPCHLIAPHSFHLGANPCAFLRWRLLFALLFVHCLSPNDGFLGRTSWHKPQAGFFFFCLNIGHSSNTEIHAKMQSRRVHLCPSNSEKPLVFRPQFTMILPKRSQPRKED